MEILADDVVFERDAPGSDHRPRAGL